MPKKYTLKHSPPACELGEYPKRRCPRARWPCGAALPMGGITLIPKHPGIWGNNGNFPAFRLKAVGKPPPARFLPPVGALGAARAPQSPSHAGAMLRFGLNFPLPCPRCQVRGEVKSATAKPPPSQISPLIFPGFSHLSNIPLLFFLGGVLFK